MEQKYSLLSHNTFGIDVSAACFLEYASVDELRGLIGSGRVTSPYLHIGGGSNLLFTKDYEGTILHSRIGGVEVVAETDDDIVVRVGAGVGRLRGLLRATALVRRGESFTDPRRGGSQCGAEHRGLRG